MAQFVIKSPASYNSDIVIESQDRKALEDKIVELMRKSLKKGAGASMMLGTRNEFSHPLGFDLYKFMGKELQNDVSGRNRHVFHPEFGMWLGTRKKEGEYDIRHETCDFSLLVSLEDWVKTRTQVLPESVSLRNPNDVELEAMRLN